MAREISIQELDEQRVEMLPRRETLGYFKINKAFIYATNQALALNAASYNATAVADAQQYITVVQN
jgi:hypothetical protein